MVRNADVVITCDESDARWAEKLWRDLRTAGFDVVLANADVDAVAAIQTAPHLVLFWSRHAAQSERVTIQRHAFVEAYGRDLSEHLLIQVWLDETTLPYPELQAVSGLRDANAYRQGPDAIEPLVWSDAVRQITTALRSKTHDEASDRSDQSPAANSKSAPPLPPTSRARSKSAPVPNAPVRPQSSREGPSVAETTGNEGPTDYATVIDAQQQNRAQQNATQVETPRAQPKKAVEERVAAHADNPALVDELGRRPFAEVIAQRIDEVHRAAQTGTSQDAGAFVINLHGPWGSGKTSVLNFLKENLQDETRAAKEQWVVVDFNAWRHQRLQPPWWTLIKQIHVQALGQLDRMASARLRARWFWWRCRADWLPAVATVILVGVALTAMTMTLVQQGAPAAGDTGVGKAMELGLGVITALLATGGALLTFSRSLLFGSATAAQAYMDARSDPLGPIIALFEKLVGAIERPVVVFIDDLDRCDGTYVIALLEGIQTLFRTRRVTYVIAADRKWICSCFEKRYAEFSKTIGEPGRPLGYLFLDKVFQVSASVPRVSAQMQESYWQSLLRAGASTQPKPTEIDKIQKQEQRKAEVAAKDVRTVQEGDRKIAEASAQGPVAEQAMRAAVAKQITSPEAMQETEHRLQPFAHLLEANPRAMKRLVNAYGLYQAAHILERRQVSPEALARWTIVELRWPLLAEQLASRPQLLNEPSSPSGLSKALKSLLEECDVKEVLTGTPPAGDVLDAGSLRSIVGSTEEPRRQAPAAGPAESGHYVGV